MNDGKTYLLRIVLQKQLKEICNNVYFERNNEKKIVYPYIVWDLSGMAGNYQTEINIYDKGLSSKQVENLADSVEKHFKRFYHKDQNQVFWTISNTRNKVDEDNKEIRRRRILIDIYHYGKDE